MSRHDLTDREWNAIRVYLPAERPRRPGRPWAPHRRVINGILWVLAAGCGWRDLPAEFGKWQTIYNRFRRWTQEGLWDRILSCLLRRLDRCGRVDRSLWCVDGSVVRAHRVAAGGRRDRKWPETQALGRSRGGYSTKIHVVTDAKGLLLGVTVTAGQEGEAPEFPRVMRSVKLGLQQKRRRPRAVAGDKAYSTRAIREWLTSRGIKDVIPRPSNQRRTGRFPRHTYRKRNIVERVIGHLKESRRVATRYDKLASSYVAMITIAAIRHLLRTN